MNNSSTENKVFQKYNETLEWGLVTKEHAIPTANQLVERIGPISLRTLHYSLVSKEIIPNTRSAYKSLSEYIVKARKDDRLSWDSIIGECKTCTSKFKEALRK
jgi:hypothetical protein